MSDSEAALLDTYSAILATLETAPHQREVHLQHIEVTKKLGLPQELDGAREMMAAYWPLEEALWLEWISDRKALLPTGPVEDLTPFMELLELYKRSLTDYLSIPLCVSYAEYLIGNYYTAQGLSAPAVATDEDEVMEDVERKVGEPDQVLGAAFSLEAVRDGRRETLANGGGHLAESATLWNVWRDFETDLLKMDPSADQLAQVDGLYLARLRVPHLGIDTTFSEYSRFVTKFDNANYDTKLPAANKIFAPSQTATNLREGEERKLKNAGGTVVAYIDYARWEMNLKKSDAIYAKSVFQRAVKDHPTDIEVWDTYLEFSSTVPKVKNTLLEVAERAVKSIPSSGMLWASYLRAAEKEGQSTEAIDGLFQRALGTGLMKESMEDLVALYEAQAAFHRREVERVLSATDMQEVEGDVVEGVVSILAEGIEKVTDASPGGDGDPHMRLEKHLIRIFERFGREDDASGVWEDLSRATPKSYAVWYGRADFEMRMGNMTKAHAVYVEGTKKPLDYPDYLYEAWLAFERQNGTLADLEYAIMQVKRLRRNAETRRKKLAAQAEAEAPVASTSIVAEAFIAAAVQEPTAEGKKRERSPGVVETAAKKPKLDVVAEEPKRDRENATIFAISEEGAVMSEEDLKTLFKECGSFRECKIKTIADRHYAMIEFMDKENVLGAQTKDKKKINDREVAVHIAWKSCLYVTNFPESYDKAAVEALFSPYGVIFDTRWPSKRFKNTRRFCYVQFTTTADAEAALALHDTEPEAGLKLVVYISDPGRRKGRTDAGVNDRELYIAGLSKFTKEADLQKLFEPFGAIKAIRMVLDDQGASKGFAFVEFEDEASAQASLTVNNQELKKRRISVTIAQARAVGMANREKDLPREARIDVISRIVRVGGLTPGTEEAVVQQAFEKIGPVKFVTMEAGSTDALIEFEEATDSGKALLAQDTITIDGATVTLAPETANSRPVDAKKPRGGAGMGMLMPRQAGRGRGKVGLGSRGGRGRGGIGSGGGGGGGGASTSASTPTSAPAGGMSQDAFRALLTKKAE